MTYDQSPRSCVQCRRHFRAGEPEQWTCSAACTQKVAERKERIQDTLLKGNSLSLDDIVGGSSEVDKATAYFESLQKPEPGEPLLSVDARPDQPATTADEAVHVARGLLKLSFAVSGPLDAYALLHQAGEYIDRAQDALMDLIDGGQD